MIISILFFLFYSILIMYYWRSWEALPAFEPVSGTAIIQTSLIIPARNEEKNITSLLNAIQQQSVPADKYEVIVVDDHSEDATKEKVKEFPFVKLLSLNNTQINSYKKKAIETGIAAATGNWIITTDADCIPGKKWLEAMTEFKSGKMAVAVAGPVNINCNNSILQIFQSIDMMVLQGITAAVLFRDKLSMCNGANFGYERSAYDQVNGFDGIDTIASGDDMLLLYKLRTNYPGRIHYIKSKEAIVATEPMKNWKDFFNQRIRWASKARKYQDKRLLPVLVLVYLFNLLFPVLLIAGFFQSRYWLLMLALWAGKTIIELPFFISLSRFFNKPWAVKMFPFFQPLHIGYTVFTGLLGQFGKYEWKGRRVK